MQHSLTNLPKRLFKFYSYNDSLNEKRLSGEVFLASPLDFNDPCDCQRDIINNAGEKERDNGAGWLKRKLLELGYNDAESDALTASLLAGDTDKYEVYKKQLEKVGILCLTPHSTDTLMWGYYASNQGLCIEYDRDKLVKRLVIGFVNTLDYFTVNHLCAMQHYGIDPAVRTPDITQEEVDSAGIFTIADAQSLTNAYLKANLTNEQRKYFLQNIFLKRVAGADIIYRVKPDGSPSSLFFDKNNNDSKLKYYVKTKTWSHENEFRIVVSLGGKRAIPLGKDVVKNIYIGCNTKTEKVVELAYLASKLSLNAGFYKMRRLKNCGLQAVKLDLSKLIADFPDTEKYLKEKFKLYW